MRPLGWDSSDAGAVADVALFLLSDLGRAISGEIVHADGGFHAMGVAGVGAPAVSESAT